MLSLVSPVCEFSTVSEMAKSLFIPGIFDKTLMMVDKNTGIADLILTFVKSKSVSIIVRKMMILMKTVKQERCHLINLMISLPIL